MDSSDVIEDSFDSDKSILGKYSYTGSFEYDEVFLKLFFN